jgi:hypothetical protein
MCGGECGYVAMTQNFHFTFGKEMKETCEVNHKTYEL